MAPCRAQPPMVTATPPVLLPTWFLGVILRLPRNPRKMRLRTLPTLPISTMFPFLVIPRGMVVRPQQQQRHRPPSHRNNRRHPPPLFPSVLMTMATAPSLDTGHPRRRLRLTPVSPARRFKRIPRFPNCWRKQKVNHRAVEVVAPTDGDPAALSTRLQRLRRPIFDSIIISSHVVVIVIWTVDRVTDQR